MKGRRRRKRKRRRRRRRGYQIKMGGRTCSLHGRDKKYVSNFCPII
jgi:hypothetical protein